MTKTVNNRSAVTSEDIPIPQAVARKMALAIGIIFLIPSLLSSPENAFSIEENPFEFVSVAHGNIFAAPIPTNWDPLLVDILQNEVSRHNITDPEWTARVDAFIAMTKHIESNGRQNAYNPSGAMSYFQFKGPSLETAYNRLINYMQRYDMGRTPGWSKSLANNPQSIYNVRESRQAVFMMINIIEQDNKLGLFEKFLAGDESAAKDIYYRYHHTAPDYATKKRTERYFNHYFNN